MWKYLPADRWFHEIKLRRYEKLHMWKANKKYKQRIIYETLNKQPSLYDGWRQTFVLRTVLWDIPDD